MPYEYKRIDRSKFNGLFGFSECGRTASKVRSENRLDG